MGGRRISGYGRQEATVGGGRVSGYGRQEVALGGGRVSGYGRQEAAVGRGRVSGCGKQEAARSISSLTPAPGPAPPKHQAKIDNVLDVPGAGAGVEDAIDLTWQAWPTAAHK